jgi:SAM-dependent methyltransferase
VSQQLYDAEYAARQLNRSRDPLRRFVKNRYLANVLKDVKGATLDFGCGAGQLLEKLPTGSVGLEVNAHLVEALREKGLPARQYDPGADQLRFDDIPDNTFTTLVMSHVLEHFDDAADGLRRILESCGRLGISRVIVIVPGRKGYEFDPTHRTFVDRFYLKEHGLTRYAGFSARNFSYFPLNRESVGRFFTFHEFKVVFDAD